MVSVTQDILQQIISITNQISKEDYGKPLPDYLNGSIGKHTRHIIEFYSSILSPENKTINYDNRKRDVKTECDPVFATEQIEKILNQITHLNLDKEATLTSLFPTQTVQTPTTLQRELIYVLEHTIHHLAIIRMMIEKQFDYIKIPAQTGFGYSTLKHLKSK